MIYLYRLWAIDCGWVLRLWLVESRELSCLFALRGCVQW